jgi:hypothetical protein
MISPTDALVVTPLALAAGIWIFLAVVLVLLVGVVIGFYTVGGSGISQTPYRRDTGPPESPSDVAHDEAQDISNLTRGTAGHHGRRRPAPTRAPTDPVVAAALEEWRHASVVNTRLDPPLGPTDHVSGTSDTPTIAMYVDLTSEASWAAWLTIARLLERRAIRVGVRHLPLADVHPLALPAAEALEAAGAQGRFFELLDRLARDRFDDEAGLLAIAANSVDDPGRLRSEVGEGRYRGEVAKHIRWAISSGAHAVPEVYVHGDQYLGDLDEASLVKASA